METQLSATIIAYNEEHCIERCIRSVSWADELVVVDSFSADRTADICRRFGARVIKQKWLGYVAQKNFALEQAKHSWVLSLDADEAASQELQQEIQVLRQKEMGEVSGYYIPRKLHYLGRWIKHGGWYPDYKLRLFNKEEGRWEGKDIHETVACRGETGKLTGDIDHYSFLDISDHLRTIDKFTTISAGELQAKGKRAGIGDLTLRPAAAFLRMYLLQAGFLDGVPGLILCGLSAYHVLVKYAKLWELANEPKITTDKL